MEKKWTFYTNEALLALRHGTNMKLYIYFDQICVNEANFRRLESILVKYLFSMEKTSRLC